MHVAAKFWDPKRSSPSSKLTLPLTSPLTPTAYHLQRSNPTLSSQHLFLLPSTHLTSTSGIITCTLRRGAPHLSSAHGLWTKPWVVYVIRHCICNHISDNVKLTCARQSIARTMRMGVDSNQDPRLSWGHKM